MRNRCVIAPQMCMYYFHNADKKLVYIASPECREGHNVDIMKSETLQIRTSGKKPMLMWLNGRRAISTIILALLYIQKKRHHQCTSKTSLWTWSQNTQGYLHWFPSQSIRHLSINPTWRRSGLPDHMLWKWIQQQRAEEDSENVPSKNDITTWQREPRRRRHSQRDSHLTMDTRT